VKLTLAALLRELATLPPERLLAAADALEGRHERVRLRRAAPVRDDAEADAAAVARLRRAGIEPGDR
jgi:hypothetical protein